MNERLRGLIAGGILFFVAGMIGCTSMGRFPVADEVVPHGEDADLQTLRKGRALAVTECAGCHRTYWPREFSAKQWSDIAQNMGQRASLTTPQTKALRSYLMAAARSETTSRD